HVFKILIDDRRVSDDDPIMIEHRDLAFRIDRYEPGRVLLEPVQIHVDAVVWQALLDERNHRFERICRGFGVIVLERHNGCYSTISSIWMIGMILVKFGTSAISVAPCLAPAASKAP